MPKRPASSSSSDTAVASSSDVDTKPNVDDESDNTDDKPSPSPSPAKKKKTSPKKEPTEGKNVKRVWTVEEDIIFAELMERMCTTHMWNEVKADGRLVYRGSPGIKAHWMAVLKGLKKAK